MGDMCHALARSRRLLSASGDASPGIWHTSKGFAMRSPRFLRRGPSLLGVVSLNLWTMSHRLHDRIRDGCCWGCSALDSLDQHVECVSLRLVAGVFDDSGAPHNGFASYSDLGPASERPDVKSAIQRGVLASVASHAVRAHPVGCGPPAPVEADRIARQAVVSVCLAIARGWHEGAGRRATAFRNGPTSRRVAPLGCHRRVGPLVVVSAPEKTGRER